MLKKLSGIDEAALGPVLGPYCCSSISFETAGEGELFDIFRDFPGLKIMDSKKLYKAGKTLLQLEKTALSFITLLTGKTPETLYDLLTALHSRESTVQSYLSIPWYRNLKKATVPLECGKEDLKETVTLLSEFMKKTEVWLTSIRSEVVPALHFNRYLSEGMNKSETCLEILTPLVRESTGKSDRLVIDRQGGRRYYGDWLIGVFPKKLISIERETANLSVYRIGGTELNFQVKGDDLFFETALASIISKYLRELMMREFNRYWCSQEPSLKKTAGYPQDGRRFIKDLDNLGLFYEKDSLIRQK